MKRVMLTPPQRTARASYVRTPNPCSDMETFKKSGDHLPTPHPSPLRGKGGWGDSPRWEEKKSLAKELPDILLAVESLPAKDRKALLAHLALHDQSTEIGKERDRDMWVAAVYQAMLDAVGPGEGVGQGPAAIKRSLAASSAFGPVQEFMDTSRLAALSVAERQSVYMMLAKLVVKQAQYVARRIGAPLGLKFVTQAVPNLASIFDAAFPGYLRAGLAHIVARQLVSGRP